MYFFNLEHYLSVANQHFSETLLRDMLNVKMVHQIFHFSECCVANGLNVCTRSLGFTSQIEMHISFSLCSLLFLKTSENVIYFITRVGEAEKMDLD